MSFVLLLLGAGWATAAEKENGKGKALDRAAVERLQERMGGHARISVSPATGAVRFVTIEQGGAGDLMPSGGPQVNEKASAFIDEYASMFGLRDARRELQVGRAQTDEYGGRHVEYFQIYQGVPVFAGMLRAHFDASGALTAINGNVVPDIDLDITPTRAATEASAAAIAAVSADNPASELTARSGVLLVFRTGLAQGIPGSNHLAWQIEVGNGGDVREFVYVDAHTGKVVDRLPGIIDAMNRRAYDGQFSPQAVPPTYPGSPFWVEGDPFPTGVAEADNMITSSKEVYDLYSRAFGRDSFDGAGATMDAIFNRGNACPNASWNGTFISFCNGFTTDDVTAHEWTHAYTQYTHGLIYQWQSGALNESYSDIFGETIDRINGRDVVGNSATDPARVGACSTFSVLAPAVTINSPAAIAGNKVAGPAQFGPQAFSVTQDVVLVNDGVGMAAPPTGAGGAGDLSVMDGCETPFANAAAVAGKIALVYRGTCGFLVKAQNAQANGAIGVIISNHQLGGNATINMAGVDPATVPSLSVGNANGEAIRGQLASATVNATLTRGQHGTEASTRWLVGEDITPSGALRDMYNPTCYANPGKISDTAFYVCGPGTPANDNGGVHTNSGIPNHAYSLLVDGGSYNGQTVNAIGLTKAAHIYYRAMTVYQNPATDFADHADAIERSAFDLLGRNLKDLTTGNPSGQRINLLDLIQVHRAMVAVEMRNQPTQCNFAPPILGQNPPSLCPSGLPLPLYFDGFDIPIISNALWSVSHEGTTPDFTDRDWVIEDHLPDGRFLTAFYGADRDIGTCLPGGDETAVLHLDSPKITIPGSVTSPRLTFVHWFATEAGFDGGNVKISVNDGPWQLVQAADFIYNPYNMTLAPASAGNTNPIAGQPAFSGTDDGSTGGTWGRSIVNLAPYAHGGDRVRLRFDIGNDGCGGRFGWFVDDFYVYRCH